MKPKESPLQLIDFAITAFEFSIDFPEEEKGLSDIMKSYEIDIDFGLNSDHGLRALITAEINRGENRLPGYSLLAEVMCIFNFDHATKLTEAEKINLEGFSTIYIALNSLRGLISNFTANAPFGRYILPSIDLNDL